MSYRQTFAYRVAAARALIQNRVTSARAKRGTLDNVGKNPLKLQARVLVAGIEC